MDFIDEDLFKLAPDYNKNNNFKSMTAKDGIRSLLEAEDEKLDRSSEFEIADEIIGIDSLQIEPQAYSGDMMRNP